MRNRAMTKKQRLIYGARIRLGWFMEAEQLGSVKKACQKLGVPRSTYYFWHKKWLDGDKKLSSLFDQDSTPKSHSNDASPETIDIVIQLRLLTMYGEKALAVILARDYDLKISAHGIHNILRRANLLAKRKKRKRRTRETSDYEYYPGEVMQMDVKHWKRAAYQYDIIDCCTRIKFKYIFNSYNVNNTVKFLEMAIEFFKPAFEFSTVQMDNGPEFTNENRMKPNQTVENRMSLPDRWLLEHNIAFYHIPVRSPHLNGRIERSHGVDKRRYKELTTNSHQMNELKQFCLDDCLDYNTYRPHSQLNYMTPLEFLQSLKGYECATINTEVLFKMFGS